jgi:hypothetical protein
MSTDPRTASPLTNADPYRSVDSPSARAVLEEHYDIGADLYKFWGSPGSVLPPSAVRLATKRKARLA